MAASVPPLHSRLVLARLHLVRHGEVHNPDHLVYAALAGFGLSDLGRSEAEAAALHLSTGRIDVIAASPLQRALESALPIANRHGLEVTVDTRLIEWGLLDRWAGIVWEDLADEFPGEVDAYLSHPHDLEFSPESLDAVVQRFAAVVADLGEAHPGGMAVIVSHQDPVHAARLVLTGRSLEDRATDKPGHGTVITLEPGDPWVEAARWDPPVSD